MKNTYLISKKSIIAPFDNCVVFLTVQCMYLLATIESSLRVSLLFLLHKIAHISAAGSATENKFHIARIETSRCKCSRTLAVK